MQVFGGDDSDDEELPSAGLLTRQVRHHIMSCMYTCTERERGSEGGNEGEGGRG